MPTRTCRSTIVIIASAMAVTSGAPPAFSQPAELPPVAMVLPRDDAAADAGLVRFRTEARQTLRACTEASLRRLFPVKATANLSSAPPSAAFWHYWKVEDGSGIRGLCRLIDRALALGAVREAATSYCAPYLSCSGGTPDALPFGQYLIGVKDRVPIRARPAADATVVAEGRYPVLIDCRMSRAPNCRSAGNYPEGWSRVSLGGVAGWVSIDDVRDQMADSAVIIGRTPAGWRIVGLQFAD